MNVQKQYKIYALIPARLGSKRVKNKNIQSLGSWPLMRWSIETSKQCELIEKVVVSTDSPDYGRMAAEWGAIPLLRPEELASDNATDLDVIEHFLEHFSCDLVVYLRPTTPFRTVEMVRRAIQMIIDAKGMVTGLRSVEEMESAYKCYEMSFGFLHPICGATMYLSNLPNHMIIKTYRPNGYIDIFRPETIKQGGLTGRRCVGLVTPRVIEIDTEDDLEYAEWWISQRARRFQYGKQSN